MILLTDRNVYLKHSAFFNTFIRNKVVDNDMLHLYTHFQSLRDISEVTGLIAVGKSDFFTFMNLVPSSIL